MRYTTCEEQGWRSGESADRLPTMCSEFDSWTARGLSLLVLYPALMGFFSGNSGFPVSSKTSI